MTGLLQQLNDEVAALVERVDRSLVQVHNGGRSGGAGVIIHSDGLIVTNAHVVRRRTPQVTLPDGASLPARVLAKNRDNDFFHKCSMRLWGNRERRLRAYALTISMTLSIDSRHKPFLQSVYQEEFLGNFHQLFLINGFSQAFQYQIPL